MQDAREPGPLTGASNAIDPEIGDMDPFDLSILSAPLADKDATDNSSSPTLTQPRTSGLLSLPAELRLNIYSHLAGGRLGVDKVLYDGGRGRMRASWATAPYEYAGRSAPARNIAPLMTACRQTRGEILPMFLTGFIIKFPAWNDAFKLQCLYWIDGVGEDFIRNLTWIWLEGVYWRFSIHFIPSGVVGAAMMGVGEDEKATRQDCHQYDEAEWFPGQGFVLRVDFAMQMRRLALSAGRDAFVILEDVMSDKDDGEVGLNKEELKRVLRQAALCAGEQLRSIGPENYGVRTVLPHISRNF